MFKISPKLLPYFKGYCSSAEVILLFVYMKCRRMFVERKEELEKGRNVVGIRYREKRLAPSCFILKTE